ncbi:MAG: hypothetical protein EX341_19065 [Candidatus Scalindua sp. SCAELEC01]|nr:MAG: hypothetical protein EX341_19065 [Candidatus Scalindua sp. SCAELEC01]
MMKSADVVARKSDPWTCTLSVLLVLLWVAVSAVLLTPGVPNGHGFEHSRIPTMDQGGDGTLRHGPLLLGGWMLGSVLIATFVSLLACGTVRRRSRNKGQAAAFLAGGLLYESVFGMLCYSYQASLTESRAAFMGFFPEPLSWLLFGIWIVPGFFVALYVVFFYRWIWPPDHSKRFADLIASSAPTNDSTEPQPDIP